VPERLGYHVIAVRIWGAGRDIRHVIAVQIVRAQRSAGLDTRRLGVGQRPTKDFRYYIGLVYVNVESYLIAAAYTVLVFLVRLLVLCLMLPLFLMAAFVGFVDGLVRRDIRRFGAGRESGFVFHRAKAALIPLVVLPWAIYLALPISVSPILILLLSAVLLGVAVDIAAATFKKYL
jgi:integrating conjugative element membrane protein (TIGR03747 family)